MGRANFILDNLIAQRKAVPMIIVMPYGNMMNARHYLAETLQRYFKR